MKLFCLVLWQWWPFQALLHSDKNLIDEKRNFLLKNWTYECKNIVDFHCSPVVFTFSIWARINFDIKAPYIVSSVKIQIFQIEVSEDIISYFLSDLLCVFCRCYAISQSWITCCSCVRGRSARGVFDTFPKVCCFYHVPVFSHSKHLALNTGSFYVEFLIMNISFYRPPTEWRR